MKGHSKYRCPECLELFKCKPSLDKKGEKKGTLYFCEHCGFMRIALYDNGGFIKNKNYFIKSKVGI